jgi:hypothetical protein
MGDIHNTRMEYKLSLQLAARKHIPFWYDACGLRKRATTAVARFLLQIEIILKAQFR